MKVLQLVEETKQAMAEQAARLEETRAAFETKQKEVKTALCRAKETSVGLQHFERRS